MTHVLFLLAMPEDVRTQYRDRLRAAFPHIRVDLVDHFSKVDPYVGDIEVLITFGPMLRDEVLQKAKKLKWVQALGTGVDNLIDLPSLGPHVAITNIRGIHGPPLSESAILSMLALSRRLPRSIRSQDRRKWDRWASALIDGKTAGIFGIGAIAADMAPKLKALGMRVVGISSAPDRAIPGFDEMRSRDDLAKAVADLDFLVLLTPLTPATRHIIDAKILAAMKPSSFLVNLARGGVVHEPDLIAALEAGRIAGAALDVFEQEPLPEDHPIWSAKNVIITPHLGGFNESYVDRAMPTIVHNVQCFLAGRMDDMENIVPR